MPRRDSRGCESEFLNRCVRVRAGPEQRARRAEPGHLLQPAAVERIVRRAAPERDPGPAGLGGRPFHRGRGAHCVAGQSCVGSGTHPCPGRRPAGSPARPVRSRRRRGPHSGARQACIVSKTWSAQGLKPAGWAGGLTNIDAGLMRRWQARMRVENPVSAFIPSNPPGPMDLIFLCN